MARRPRIKEVHRGDRVFLIALRAVGIATMGLILAIFFRLIVMAMPILKSAGIGFFFGTGWNPVQDKFGAAAFIYGTLTTSFLGLAIAVPVSVGVALFLTEIAPRGIASGVGFLVEMLAAIPSVVYGLWGVFVLAPWLRDHAEPWLQAHFGFLPIFEGAIYGVGYLAAGIILAIMITPTISAICREVFKAVPGPQREGALALGATRWEMIRLSVLNSSLSGVFGAGILGLGRALGETMAVTMVIGNSNKISGSLFQPGQTMASIIANEYAEASGDLHLSALAGIGLALFLVSLVVSLFARLMLWRFRSREAQA